MSVQNPERVVTKQDLADFYGEILPYLGGMPEMLANKFSKANLYSTTEKIVGQWIDGKPVYQKSVAITIPDSSGSLEENTYSVSPNIDNVVDIEGYFTNGVAWNMLPNRILCMTTSSPTAGLSVFFTGGVLKVQSNASNFNGRTGYATVRYTKSTDSAIAVGSDTDYSTTEKIVGTWTNGKPLYQKTLTVSSIPKTSTNTLITNIDTLISTVQSHVRNGIRETVGSFYTSSSDYFFVIMAVSNNNFYAYWSGSSNVSDWIITVQYTKTTD